MVISNQLAYALTRNNNAFLKKSLNGALFTSDPFSANNIPKASAIGFHTRGAKGVVAGKDGKITVSEYKSRHRITKKGKKKSRKALTLGFSSKTVDAKKSAGKGSNLAGKRAAKLQSISLQAARRAKQ